MVRIERLESRVLLAAGSVLREVWTGVPGAAIDDLTSLANYPSNPSSANFQTSGLQSPDNAGDDFGERLRGYVTAPQTGNYRFSLSANESAELFLSNSRDPGGRMLIAVVTSPGQAMSNVVKLVAGQEYFFEVLHKESGGDDGLAVGWTLPDGTTQPAIPAAQLSPVLSSIRVWSTVPNAYEGSASPGKFTIERTGGSNALPIVVSYAMSGSAISGSDYASPTGSVTIPAGATSADVLINTLDDDASGEANESATITLLPGSDYTLDTPANVTSSVTIVDNDDPVGGTNLLPADVAGSMQLLGNGIYGMKSIVNVTGMPFAQAMQVQTTAKPANIWLLQLNQLTTANISAGDTIYLQFHARSMTASPAQVEAIIERASEPYNQLYTYNTTIGTSWTKLQLPFTATASYTSGAAQLNFRLGFDPQTIQIGGVVLANFAASKKPRDLPTTPLTYDWRDMNAPWRQEAEIRIDQSRKGDLTVTVRDAAGNAVDGAQVTVHQTRQSFGFGGAMNGTTIVNDLSADGDIYRNLAAQFFNIVTIENELKWPEWEANRNTALAAADWVIGQGIGLRGHNLVWPSWQFMPWRIKSVYDWILNDSGSPAVAADWLKNEITAHLADEAAALTGKAVAWDVVNEPFTNHDAMDVLGNAVVIDWYKTVRQADPNAVLFVNDFNISTDPAHADNYYNWIQFLLNGGAPLGGIGTQDHFGAVPPSLAKVSEFFDRFGSFGLPIEVTEFDLDTTDEQLQADFARDYMTFVFSQPLASAFITWEYWAGNCWLPNGALFREDWSMRPWAQQWLDLTRSQWMTDAAGTTINGGQFSTRGFTGEYDVTVTINGQTKIVQTTLDTSGQNLVVTMNDLGAISGTIFNDPDSNGVRDAGDQPLAGRTVYIDANNNNVLDAGETSTTSDAAGNYAFAGLSAGTHVVREILPAGWRKTAPAGVPQIVVLSAGQNASGRDFGNTTNILLAGVAFNDANANGVKDAGETGLAGVTVNIVSNNTVVATRTTDANGFWRVQGLSQGTGHAVATAPAGYATHAPAGGTYTGSMSSGQANANLNFGLRPAATAPAFPMTTIDDDMPRALVAEFVATI